MNCKTLARRRLTGSAVNTANLTQPIRFAPSLCDWQDARRIFGAKTLTIENEAGAITIAMQKRIIVIYIGGNKDGARFDSRIPADRNEVEAVLLLTQKGTEGKSLRTKTEAYKKWRRDHDIEDVKGSGLKYHVYKITNREETDSEIVLTLSFSGYEPKYPQLPTLPPPASRA